jgi:hypothetical protein
MALVYPVLAGQSLPVVKRPIWSSVRATAASGKEYSHTYWTNPTWEWDIPYEYLPDAQMNGTTYSDLKTLIGFFNAVQGDYGRFCFQDPDDYQINQFPLGVTDGTTTSYVIQRPYGVSPNYAYEPVGIVNTGSPVNVYLGTTLQTSGYTINTSIACNQLVTFSTAPTAGVNVKISCNFYYWCRFKDPTYDFEKFANLFWDTKKVTIHSLKSP